MDADTDIGLLRIPAGLMVILLSVAVLFLTIQIDLIWANTPTP